MRHIKDLWMTKEENLTWKFGSNLPSQLCVFLWPPLFSKFSNSLDQVFPITQNENLEYRKPNTTPLVICICVQCMCLWIILGSSLFSYLYPWIVFITECSYEVALESRNFLCLFHCSSKFSNIFSWILRFCSSIWDTNVKLLS